MPLLDIFTLIVVFVVGNLLVASLMLVAFHGRLTPVLQRWIACLVVQALGWALIATCNGKLPLIGFLSISISYALMLSALIRHFGISDSYAWHWWPVLLTVVFALTVESTVQKQMIGNLIAALQVFLSAMIVLWQKNQRTLLRGLMGLSGVFGAGMLVSRAISLTQVGTVSCMAIASTPELSVMFLSFFVFRFTFMFGFILLIEGKQREEVTRLATLDPLTEAYNRRTFIELATRELKQCLRSGRPLSVMVLDLDHFKDINDNHGHLAGDKVLCRVKRIIDDCLRAGDLSARYGGEEFVVLLPETSLSGALKLAERLREAIAEVPNAGIAVTASMGVASLEVVDETWTLERLLARADKAMYAAKFAGRNRVSQAINMHEATGAFAAAAS